jgi:hypothetical protein
MTQNFTYGELLNLVPSYTERKDAAFLAQVPTFISLAENRLATDMKQQGFQSVVKGTLPLVPVMAKPAFWRSTISFSYTSATGEQTMSLRSLEYLKAYWPNKLLTAAPSYYADYNINNFLLAATPDQAYPFELVYYARLQPLSPSSQSNWLTHNAPQALLYAILMEAALWTKNPDRVQAWGAQYADAKGGIVMENQERLSDRNTVVTRA